MAGMQDDGSLKDVHRLFQRGTVAALSDAELLDRFVSRRDEAAEAAFEALVERHGPMVYRVCRGVLRNVHDAEDAFQAVFLVLANRAGLIRSRGSLASWLFGVAHNVAYRLKRSATRRQALNQRFAGLSPEGELTTEGDPDPDWDVLHDEIRGLPERLRAPIVLCYLQGLTYDVAALRLGLSSVAVRGRLARARTRLRERLVRRGVAVPAGLLVAGSAGQAESAISVALVQSTLRIALGFVAGNAAAVLARGVENSMLLNQMKVALALIGLGLGGSYFAWHAIAQPIDDKPGVAQAPGVVKKPAEEAKSKTPRPATIAYALKGSVVVEGTNEGVPGATIQVMAGDSGAAHRGEIRTATSDADGRFSVDLTPGNARAWTLIAPLGYWAPRGVEVIEEFAVSRGEPTHRKDYVVRRGTVWDFRIHLAGGAKPQRGSVFASNPSGFFRNGEDGSRPGIARLTLPTEGSKVTAYVSEKLEDSSVALTLEWESGFRPDTLKSVKRLGGSPASYRLEDEAGKSATISGPEKARLEPKADGRNLVVDVSVPDPDPKELGELAGKVVDEAGKAIEGAQVALIWVEEHGGSGMSHEGHMAKTDAEGNFLIRKIPMTRPDDKPVLIELAVTRQGFAGIDTKSIRFQPSTPDRRQTIEPVKLAKGGTISGKVVGLDDKPLAGAWIEPGGSYASRSRFGKTDENGRFTIRDLPLGMVPLNFRYGKLMVNSKFLALPEPEAVTVKLKPMLDAAQLKAQAEAAKAARPTPPALGTPAPKWSLVGSTEGKVPSLEDLRGKPIFLDFWGVWCGPCVNTLPTLEKLRQKFEPRGVAFVSIHTPGEEMAKIRRVLEFKKTTLTSALDEGSGGDSGSYNGVTANRYGVNGYPTIVLIDREGKLAFHSGINTKEGVTEMKALGKEMGFEESTMTEEDFYKIWEAYFGRQIEKLLEQK